MDPPPARPRLRRAGPARVRGRLGQAPPTPLDANGVAFPLPVRRRRIGGTGSPGRTHACTRVRRPPPPSDSGRPHQKDPQLSLRQPVSRLPGQTAGSRRTDGRPPSGRRPSDTQHLRRQAPAVPVRRTRTPPSHRPSRPPEAPGRSTTRRRAWVRTQSTETPGEGGWKNRFIHTGHKS